MSEVKFKVGDRVRCICDDWPKKEGDVATVDRYSDTNLYLVHSYYEYDPANWELVVPDAVPDAVPFALTDFEKEFVEAVLLNNTADAVAMATAVKWHFKTVDVIRTFSYLGDSPPDRVFVDPVPTENERLLLEPWALGCINALRDFVKSKYEVVIARKK